MSQRTWPAKLTLSIGSLVMIFAVLEVGFRFRAALAARGAGAGWAVYDEDLGYRLNPGFGDTNADGLRDRPVAPKAGRFRVLMLGDSVGYYGDDVDDTYVGRLRTRLAENPGLAPFDVLNAGIKGYTNYQELVFLEKYGVGFEPDLVGVGFVLNDLHRILHRFRVENGRIVGDTYDFTPEAQASVDSPLVRAARTSLFLVWLYRRLGTAAADLAYRIGGGFAFDQRLDLSTAWKDESWPAIESQLAAMKGLGVERGFGLFLVSFPFGEQYRADYLARDRRYVLKPQRRLQEICRRLEIPYLDLYGELEPTHLESDGIHLTRSGRESAAEAIASFIEKQQLIPRWAGSG